jgi:hypothetical protein
LNQFDVAATGLKPEGFGVCRSCWISGVFTPMCRTERPSPTARCAVGPFDRDHSLPPGTQSVSSKIVAMKLFRIICLL